MVNYKERIGSDPRKMLGKPVIRNTRITVEAILWKIASGFSFEEILDMYPHLELDDILAAVGYAASVMESEEVIPAA